MRKSLVALVVAGFAVAAAVTPAQAKGKGFGLGLGVGLVVGGIIASQHHRHHHRPVVVQPQPYPVATRPLQPVVPLIRTADDRGRFYDAASKTWFDGGNQCFTGANGWSVKSGSWFYGTAPWTEKDGIWQAAAGIAPTPVECAGIPVIAARMPKPVTDRTATTVVPSSDDHAAATPVPAPEQTTPVASNAVEGAAQAGLGMGGSVTN